MSFRTVLLGMSIFLNLVLFWALIWGGHGWLAYKNLSQEATALQERIESVSSKNLALSREIRLLLSDDKYVEQVIRKRLNFVKNNEIWYVFPERPVLPEGEGTDETEN